MKIFIADDDKILRLGLRSKIEKNTSNQVVGEANNGVEALEILKKTDVDLLITDIKMPGLNGVELIKKIREEGLKFKIVVLSGYDEYQFVRETLKYGAADYLLKPVENRVLFELLDRIEADIERECKNEQQIRLFNEKVSESMNVLKEKFLIELVKGSYTDADSCRKKLEEFGLKKVKPMILAAIGLDSLYKVKREIAGESNIIKLDPIRNKIESILASLNLNSATLITIYKSEIIVLLSDEEGKETDLAGEVATSLELVGSALEEESGFTITAGTSRVYESPEKTYIAYQQALLAFNRRFYEGKDRVITYEPDKCCYVNMDERKLADRLELISSFLSEGHSNRVKKAVSELFDWMCKQRVDPVQMREICLGIITRMCSASGEFGSAVDSLKDEEFDICYFIREVDTYLELKEYIATAFYKISEKMNYARQEKSKRIIDISRDYIQKHYNEDISLKTIADLVHLNPNYFSEYFKNEIGKNFYCFVTETKINIAKKLLINPEIRVYEVGQLVGYNEPVSFNRAFKRVEGVSPAEYRKIILDK